VRELIEKVDYIDTKDNLDMYDKIVIKNK